MCGACRQACCPLGGEQSCQGLPVSYFCCKYPLTQPSVFNPRTVGSDSFSCQPGQSSAASVQMPAKLQAMYQGIRSSHF